MFRFDSDSCHNKTRIPRRSPQPVAFGRSCPLSQISGGNPPISEEASVIIACHKVGFSFIPESDFKNSQTAQKL